MKLKRVPQVAWLASCVFFVGCTQETIPGPPAGVTLTPRGHQELRVEEGRLRAHWLGRDREVGFCLQAPLSRDTSQWRASARINDVVAQPPEPADARWSTDTSVCFAWEIPTGVRASDRLEICAELRDDFTKERFRLPCLDAAWTADASDFLTMLERGNKLQQPDAERDRRAYVTALDRLAVDAAEKDYPALAVRLRLIAVDALRRQPTSAHLSEIDQRLDALPAWLDQDEAAALSLAVDSGRAKLALARDDLRQAWLWLRQAESKARRVAGRQRLAILVDQVNILRRQGAATDAAARLAQALEDCDRWPCDTRQVPAAHGLLAWIELTDADPDGANVTRARAHLEAEATFFSPATNPLEIANHLINRALAERLAGQEPASYLAAARSRLASAETTPRVASLRAWADLIEGLAALDRDDTAEAIRLCTRAAGGHEAEGAVGIEGTEVASPPARVAAWAWSCQGRAYRRDGALAAAAAAFEEALIRHHLAAPHDNDHTRQVPGQRTDDTYRAARVAIERGRTRDAWHGLDMLDHLGTIPNPNCSTPRGAATADLDAQRQALRDRLAWAERPQTPSRQQQLDGLRFEWRQTLESIHRQMLNQCGDTEVEIPAPPHVRAFALPDEIIALFRRSDGRIVARRTPMARGALHQRLAQLEAEQQRVVHDRESEQRTAPSDGGAAVHNSTSSRSDDDQRWRALAQPFADALLPPADMASGRTVRFALYGGLQRVPVAALPTRIDDRPAWFGERTTVVHRPPIVLRQQAASPQPAGPPLFIVDPQRNLASGRSAQQRFGTRFPEATVLYGAAATREAVDAALPSAAFLHVDAHGRFEGAFPTLSGLQLHDGLTTIGDLLASGFPERLVNLSGCFTGKSADSGTSSFDGLAGFLALRGVRWVVASRAAGSDLLLAAFNEGFYRRLAAGQSVPQAYGDALGELRSNQPAAAWSTLLLIGTDSIDSGQESSLPDYG